MGSTYFTKRIFNLARHSIGGRNRSPRPKTFVSEEAAKKWADLNGVTNYTLENLRVNDIKKKIRIMSN